MLSSEPTASHIIAPLLPACGERAAILAWNSAPIARTAIMWRAIRNSDIDNMLQQDLDINNAQCLGRNE